MIDITSKTKAVTRFASTDETRPGLNAVCFEADGTQVATDGHTLARLKLAALVDVAELPVMPFSVSSNGHRVLISADTVDTAIKALPRKPAIPALGHVVASEADGAGALTLGVPQGATLPATVVDEIFPDYTQVMPNPDTMTEEVGFNAHYLLRIAQAAIDLHKAVETDRTKVPVIKLQFKKATCSKHDERDASCPKCAATQIDPLCPMTARLDTKAGDSLEMIVMPCHL